MTSAKRVEANRKNASKSTGPKSDAGKARSARNSTKHGLTAQPEAAPDAPDGYRESLRAWVDELRPSGVVERALVERACRGSWRLDRCARFEDASAARLARSAVDRHDLDERARVVDLGRRLLVFPTPSGSTDDPGVLVADLEQTARGAEWLFGRWASLGLALDEDGSWDTTRKVEAIRLMGLRPEEIMSDRAAGAVVLACNAAVPKDTDVWGVGCMLAGHRHDHEEFRLRYETLVSRSPGSRNEGLRQLRALVRNATKRLEKRRAEVLDARAAADREGAADRALLDMGPSAALLLLRYEGASTRQLHKSLADLAKLRNAASESVRRDDVASTARAAEPEADSPPPEAARPAADAGDAGPGREESAKQSQRGAARDRPDPATRGSESDLQTLERDPTSSGTRPVRRKSVPFGGHSSLKCSSPPRRGAAVGLDLHLLGTSIRSLAR